MPPHGAPLGMLYYHGDKFAELKDKLMSRCTAIGRPAAG